MSEVDLNADLLTLILPDAHKLVKARGVSCRVARVSRCSVGPAG